ncbi:MAG: SDR family oxidoreductase [Candidatus Thorarchaeota archaeon]
MTKRILITGASSGIGEAIALEMAPGSHTFYLTGRNEERLRDVCKKVKSLGGTVFTGIGDVSDEESVDIQFSEAEAMMGGIDVLVANAGVGYYGNLEEMTISQFDEQFNTNVRGVFLWMRKVLPGMKERNMGQIIVTSSNLGLKTSPRTSIYSGTKHAVQAMVWCLRAELKGTMVKAATINPGSVSTPWFDGKDVNRENMLTAEDVAKAAKLIIDQDETSNIDHILLHPGRS